jgi:hypothetical protein
LLTAFPELLLCSPMFCHLLDSSTIADRGITWGNTSSALSHPWRPESSTKDLWKPQVLHSTTPLCHSFVHSSCYTSSCYLFIYPVYLNIRWWSVHVRSLQTSVFMKVPNNRSAEGRGNRFLWDIGSCLPSCMVSDPIRNRQLIYLQLFIEFWK